VKVGKKIVAVFPTLSNLYPRVCPRFAHGSCLISNGIYIMELNRGIYQGRKKSSSRGWEISRSLGILSIPTVND